jgi:hypothetical protein
MTIHQFTQEFENAKPQLNETTYSLLVLSPTKPR